MEEVSLTYLEQGHVCTCVPCCFFSCHSWKGAVLGFLGAEVENEIQCFANRVAWPEIYPSGIWEWEERTGWFLTNLHHQPELILLQSVAFVFSIILNRELLMIMLKIKLWFLRSFRQAKGSHLYCSYIGFLKKKINPSTLKCAFLISSLMTLQTLS